MTGVVDHPKVEGVAVGDDGSVHSRDAVRWAAREAVLRGSALYVLLDASHAADLIVVGSGHADESPAARVAGGRR